MFGAALEPIILEADGTPSNPYRLGWFTDEFPLIHVQTPLSISHLHKSFKDTLSVVSIQTLVVPPNKYINPANEFNANDKYALLDGELVALATLKTP